MKAIYRLSPLTTSSSSLLTTPTLSYQPVTSTHGSPRLTTSRCGHKKTIWHWTGLNEGDHLCWHKEEASSCSTSSTPWNRPGHVSENPWSYYDKRSIRVWSYPPHHRLRAYALRVLRAHGICDTALQIGRRCQATVCIQRMGWIYYGSRSATSWHIRPPQAASAAGILSLWHSTVRGSAQSIRPTALRQSYPQQTPFAVQIPPTSISSPTELPPATSNTQ